MHRRRTSLVAPLLSSAAEESGRRMGVVVLGGLVLVGLPAGAGPNVGAGFVRRVALAVIGLATIRLALGVAAGGRAR